MYFEGFSFEDFSVELEDFGTVRTKKFDRIWKWSFGGSVPNHILRAGVIYMSSTDHHLYAVNAQTGKTIWKFRAGEVVFGAATTLGNLVVFGAFDGCVYAIDMQKGELKWRFRTGGPISVAPNSDGSRVFVGSRDGFLYALDGNGRELWRFRAGDEIACSPSVFEGRVFFGSFDSNFYCLDCKTGKEIWRFRTGGEIAYDRPTLVDNDVVYFTSFDNHVYALNVSNGKEKWRFRAGKYGVSCPVKRMKDMLFTGTRDGIFYALTLEGKEIWRFRMNGMVIGFSFRNGKIYIPCEDGNLYVLSEDGREEWRFTFGKGGSFDTPSFMENLVFVGSMDCHLYAIDAETGKEKWRVGTSSSTPSTAPPPHEEFEVVVKKNVETPEEKVEYEVTEGGRSGMYGLRPQYAFKHEYAERDVYG